MTRELIDEVVRKGSVDKNGKRYRLVYKNDYAEIQVLPLELLDTTEALTGWRPVVAMSCVK